MSTAKITANTRLTVVWLVLAVITIAAWWLGPARAQADVNTSAPITFGVLGMALVKARLIIQHFMEAHTAPRWLSVATDAWLVVLWGAILAIYLW